MVNKRRQRETTFTSRLCTKRGAIFDGKSLLLDF